MNFTHVNYFHFWLNSDCFGSSNVHWNYLAITGLLRDKGLWGSGFARPPQSPCYNPKPSHFEERKPQGFRDEAIPHLFLSCVIIFSGMAELQFLILSG
jgi:hypothetical protein